MWPSIWSLRLVISFAFLWRIGLEFWWALHWIGSLLFCRMSIFNLGIITCLSNRVGNNHDVTIKSEHTEDSNIWGEERRKANDIQADERTEASHIWGTNIHRLVERRPQSSPFYASLRPWVEFRLHNFLFSHWRHLMTFFYLVPWISETSSSTKPGPALIEYTIERLGIVGICLRLKTLDSKWTKPYLIAWSI